MDVLIDKIIEKKNPSVIGLDPRPEYIPPHIMKKHISEKGETLEAAADAYFEFNRGLIDAIWEVVLLRLPQAAFYELLGPRVWRLSEGRSLRKVQRPLRYWGY